jgi:hypothetical protein
VSDIFDFLDNGAVQGNALPSDHAPDEVVSAPSWFMLVMLAELVVAAALLLPESKPLHIIGYAIAAVGVSLTVIMFRSVDRTRRRSSAYVNHSWPQVAAVASLVCGLVIAMAHAYFFAQNKQVAA